MMNCYYWKATIGHGTIVIEMNQMLLSITAHVVKMEKGSFRVLMLFRKRVQLVHSDKAYHTPWSPFIFVL
jgi:hypothetical protein